MGKYVLYTQPNYVHPKLTQTYPFDTPTVKQNDFYFAKHKMSPTKLIKQ